MSMQACTHTHSLLKNKELNQMLPSQYQGQKKGQWHGCQSQGGLLKHLLFYITNGIKCSLKVLFIMTRRILVFIFTESYK